MRSFVLFSIFLLAHIYSYAGVTVVSAHLRGDYDVNTNPLGIQTTATSYLKDDQYDFMFQNPSTWDDVFTNCDHQNRVILRYEEGRDREYYGTPWSLAVQCTLKKWDQTGAVISPDEYFTLTIDYDPDAGTIYNDKDVYVSTDPGYKVQLIVGTITKTGAISATDIPADVVLETEIEVTRSYAFDQSIAPASITNSGVQGDNTFNIRWAFLPGAESYDLEFLHVSSYDPVSVASPDFSRATRINTPNQSYTINLAYDDGYILYRVRGVGCDCNSSFRREGVWSSTSTPVAVTNIDEYRNWQYSAVYAEDGKRKEVISFYDGTGKQRQAVTLNNTDNVTLIGETMYDYEGRAAVQTLPAPEEGRSSELMYYESFSLIDGTSNPYTRKVFDSDENFNTGMCTFGAVPGMDNDQGASNYYSANNNDVNNGMYQALPDAQLYPFVHTVYGPDGRPAKQSAPGPDHKIGSGHEMQSFYTSPTQERIDRLFGNEVGYAEHYNQVSTTDPNGQMSVSYLDLSGRVIATSLVGESPSNVNALASNQSATLTESFDNSNVFDPSTGTWTVNFYYMVNTAGTYTFTYVMTPEQYESLCTGDDYNCVYDMEINIYDGCDNPMEDDELVPVLGEPFTITYAPAYDFTKTFEVTFSATGVYRIQKVLSLNQAALDAAVADFQANLPDECIQSLAEIEAELNGVIDSTECQGCDSSCIVKAWALELEGEEFTAFVDSCQTHDCTGDEYETSNCEAMLDVFAGDLSPGGQYFDNIPAGTSGTPTTTWLTTNLWVDGSPSTTWDYANFLDPSGNVIESWDDMRTYWQNGWAIQAFSTTVYVGGNPYNSLVEFHPEYCHYGWCETTADSREFDLTLLQHDTYAWANTTPGSGSAAWIYNPGGSNEEGTNMISGDPYFTTSPGSADASAMQAKVDDYDGLGTSMWDYADAQSSCTNCDEHWVLFRGLYLSEKAKLMQARNTCDYLCDDDEPMDFYADNCSSAETEGFMIRVPLIEGMLTTEPSGDWETNSQTLVSCNTPASEAIDMEEASAEWGEEMDGCIEVIIGGVDISCGMVCLDGIYTPEQVASALVSAINSCVSAPNDYTATINPADPSEFFVYAPASLGATANSTGITLEFLGSTWNPGFELTGGTTVSGTDCYDKEHCFCQELKLYGQYYNATNPESPYEDDYIVDHSEYETLEEYITYVLNTSYDAGTNETEVGTWIDNCIESDLADPTDGGEDPLPDMLDCENPDSPCMEDGYDITNYYANVFYQQQVEQATQDFIAGYIAHCFGGDFNEDFSVEHPDREYHFTLYYYDQAGNLTRTVPPHAVEVFDGTQTAFVNSYRTTGSGSPQYPNHERGSNNLVTNYKYNSFDNLIESATPDGGTTEYFYDNIGRIVASQNAKQAAMSDHVYSYTFYDAQGRIYEVGQVISTSVISSTVTATMSAWETFVAAGTREQVTSTYYDESLNGTVAGTFYGGQNYLRKRVTSITIEQAFDNNPDTYDHATHFSYDVHGNVNEFIQEYPEFEYHNQRYKHICYEYDLISGNVNLVMYQHDPYNHISYGDQFYHRYYYDADNRVTNVYTSIDSVIWEQDQKYFYYLHGPLGRSETGDLKVQGTDYAYTIHGWIKGVNSNIISRTRDIGSDAEAENNTTYTSRAGMHSNIGLDAYGYVLGYYWNTGTGAKDWEPINSNANDLYNDAPTLTNTSDDLFNGNIKEMSTALSMPNGTSNPALVELIFNRYRYDQLNRIVSQTSYLNGSTTGYTGSSTTGDFTNTFTYDAAGNIQKQLRNGNSVSGQSMDSLTYHYYRSGGHYKANADGSVPFTGTNQLCFVDDSGTPGNYIDDIEDQSANNYVYDEIGNLIYDDQEEIDNIEWNAYGKIQRITRDGTSLKPDLEFVYDAFGNRVGKIVKPRTGSGYEDQDQWTYTYYIRDATGNVMSTYTRSYIVVDGDEVDDKLQLTESHLYGAQRIGIFDRERENIYSVVHKTYSTITAGEYVISGVLSTDPLTDADLDTPERTLGMKVYEFTNHLGNVLVTLSDRKVAVNNAGDIDYFTSDVKSYSDYAAFGAALPGRHGGAYRYEFNGKERDIETDLQDYGMRIYNARLGKFLSIDPIAEEFPWNSTYAFAENDVIRCIDLEGAEKFLMTENTNPHGQIIVRLILISVDDKDGIVVIEQNNGNAVRRNFKYPDLQDAYGDVKVYNGQLIKYVPEGTEGAMPMPGTNKWYKVLTQPDPSNPGSKNDNLREPGTPIWTMVGYVVPDNERPLPSVPGRTKRDMNNIGGITFIAGGSSLTDIQNQSRFLQSAADAYDAQVAGADNDPSKVTVYVYGGTGKASTRAAVTKYMVQKLIDEGVPAGNIVITENDSGTTQPRVTIVRETPSP